MRSLGNKRGRVLLLVPIQPRIGTVTVPMGTLEHVLELHGGLGMGPQFRFGG